MINSKGKKYFVKQRRAGVLFILPSICFCTSYHVVYL